MIPILARWVKGSNAATVVAKVAAAAQIQSLALAQDVPYASGEAIKKKKSNSSATVPDRLSI